MSTADIKKLELVRKSVLMRPQTIARVKEHALLTGMREHGVIQQALDAYFSNVDRAAIESAHLKSSPPAVLYGRRSTDAPEAREPAKSTA